MDNFKKYYDNLNPDQKKAVDMVDGPVLILAGPGTGKTELLSVRAANIIKKKRALAENILILTYTNAAAKAMKERLVKILGTSGYDIETATFHSFANSIVLESEEAANYIQDKVQIEEMEQVRLLEYILDHTDHIDAIRPFKAPYFYRKAILSKISELKKDGISPADLEKYLLNMKPDNVYVEEKHIPRLKALSVVYKLYEEYKLGKNTDLFDERGRYDYDDMIIFALEAIREEKELKKSLQSQYRYIMVDEYQDTNGAQMNLLFELVDSKDPDICCVGDDDQSIYRFQGASIGNFRILKERFSDIKTVSLNDNYRSTKDIIELSSKIISHLPENERMIAKELNNIRDYKDKTTEFHEFSTEAEELLFLAEKVRELKTIIESSPEVSEDERRAPYNNIAVLVRKRDDILKVIDTFLKAGIPYATDKDTDISSERRVRQMLDALGLAYISNASDLSEKDSYLYKVLASDYFAIPMTDLLKFILHVRTKRQARREKGLALETTLFSEFLTAFYADPDRGLPTKKESDSLEIAKNKRFKDHYAMHRAGWAIGRLIQNAETMPTHAILLQYIADASIYKYILREYNDDAIIRIRDLRALSSFVNVVKEADLRKPGIRLSDFMAEIETKKEHSIALTGSMVTKTQEGVRIFTAHGSKGLEFHSVLIPFCLQHKNWPIRPRGELIPLPPEIFKAKEKASEKLLVKELNFYDETRLFYVASTRAKSHLIYTASPTDSAISSSYLSSIGLDSVESESQATEEELLVASLETTDLKDPFVGTEAVLKDLVRNLTLNPTSLNNYINCKRKFLYDNVLMLPSKKKLSLVNGNCVHKALEETYREFMKKKFPNFKFFKDSFLEELRYQGVEKAIRLGCERQVDVLRDWFEKESKEPVLPIGLEKKLAVMLDDDLMFTGKYDKTEMADEKERLVRVVDYKSGKPDEHIKSIETGTRDLASNECEGYLRQLVAYKLLFDRDKDQNKGFKVKDGELVFVEPAKTSVIKYGLKKGSFIKKRLDITDEMVAELEGVIKDAWRSIMNLEFDKLPEYDDGPRRCRNCDYKNICWE
ncbi:MAG: ATP-dependent helicase [Candidatus Omnitrophica bacterium]|nr:ATP-dependent helicase [Candidatus Omnitrophota bacterium]